MTNEEFKRMPKELGWKHEYYGDKAHIRPGHAIVLTTVMVKPRSVTAPCLIRPAKKADIPSLLPAYFAAFAETADYCDYPPDYVQKRAEEDLVSHFAGKRGNPVTTSQVAVVSNKDGIEEPIGAILIVEKEEAPLVDLLFVVPEWQHKGVATALAATALNELHAAGIKKLHSRFLLANAGSRRWHHHFGFEDEMDLWVQQAYLRHRLDELERHELIHHLTDAQYEALQEEIALRREIVKTLDEISKTQGLDAVLLHT
ncbi:MAG: GNAT family N-acetyltransferase [Chloroflexota bacterium]